MASIKGSETEKNLLKSFAGESQARNRYTMFSKQASKEGFEIIATLFMETAENEYQHAKRFFSLLEGGGVEITAMYPAGKVGTTAENLKASAMGEHEEHTELYPKFADIAEKEGFKEAAALWRLISKIEKEHEERYLRLLAKVEKGEVFKSDAPAKWVCDRCGHVHTGTEAPKICPTCQHPQAHFALKSENY
ncbi:MAG: rubrerythrin [Spirochaetes bacterium GWF1_31_7]|nr:MAG: rubrerythrin [Spirochaetes bacterium GWE1_32_154]OHD46935.1 MAG: rubrerythrin [Spirochaetes bacterium GWF1_31_7]OHD48713.1 MAG: rubrerythrin [Spirochaetes bacterium GWE2_31_10]OHD82598.1 MAG: rubrerythrin [Spirochaetes bacterium RIFOXYB1_FULL_32_8]HBD95558.1 rubrerythrin family protein [Spirochaetia bacterium]